MKYDDASWHYGGDGFPASSPEEFGGTHIALFLKWCFMQGWVGDIHIQEELEDVQRVISDELSATDFLFKYCDGKLTDEDFNDIGNFFATRYYGDNGLYLKDYGNHFGDQMYIASEGEHDFLKFAAILRKRLQNGKLENKIWWKFWL